MSSSGSDLAAWAKERFRPEIYLPLAVLLEATRAALAPAPAGDTLALRFALALVLLFAFRLWDDTASVARDARTHPERVLVRALGRGGADAGAARRAFGLALVVALGVATLLAAKTEAARSTRLLVLGATNAAAMAFYARDRLAEARGLAGSLVVLLKYPAFAVLLAAGQGVLRLHGALALALLAAAFVAYEVTDDPELRALPASRPVRLGACGVASGCALGLAALGWATAGALATAGASLLVLGASAALVREDPAGAKPSAAVRFALLVSTAIVLALTSTWRPR